MTTYDIIGTEIVVPTSTENHIYFNKVMNVFLEKVENDFNKWYDNQLNCKNVYENIDDILMDSVSPIIDKGIEMMNQNGVYSIDDTMFFNKYIDNHTESLFRATYNMMFEIDEIEDIKQEAKENRRYNKKTRRRVVGGGFGVGGALKGMATAGVLNATSGALYSMKNMVGNAGSAVAASARKSAVYSKYKPILRKEMKNVVATTIHMVMVCMEENTECSFEYLIDGEIPNKDVANAIINNYNAGKIPSARRKEQLILALKNFPEGLDIYKLLWMEYGDENGDLRKMAKAFGVPLEKYVLSLANEYCENKFLEYCKEYVDAANPILVAVRIEKNIIKAHDEIITYCKKQKIAQENIGVIKKCETILQEVENELRTVNGITYEGREIAEAVRKDRELFYHFLNGKNINDSGIYEELSSIEFRSEIYKNSLENLFQQEMRLRDATKIFTNLKIIMNKYFPEGKTKLGNIEFARIDSSFEQKEMIIRSIVLMPENEIPVMLVNRTNNGKSGILITNLALRLYSKGLLSSENRFISLHDISTISCCGNDKYLIGTKHEPIEFAIKSGLSINEQNTLCKFLQEAIFIMNNLQSTELANLKYIDSNTQKCICGSYLPYGMKICPSCFKMYTKEGLFVDTIACKFCGNRIQIGKNFCNKCGKMLNNTEEGENAEKKFIDAIQNFELQEKKGDSDQNDTVENEENRILDEQTQYCPTCGNTVKNGKKFCNKCGSPIHSELQPQYGIALCSKCGNPIKAGKSFCNKCGTKR